MSTGAIPRPITFAITRTIAGTVPRAISFVAGTIAWTMAALCNQLRENNFNTGAITRSVSCAIARPIAFVTLDIKRTERMEPVIEDGEFVYVTKVNVAGRKYTRKKTKAVMRWTQGAEYSFSEGHVIYDTPKAYRIWKEALQHISYMVNVLRSTPSKWDEDEGVNIEGSVTFLLQKPNAERTGLDKIDQYSMTQTKFVEFLRTGELEANVLEREGK